MDAPLLGIRFINTMQQIKEKIVEIDFEFNMESADAPICFLP